MHNKKQLAQFLSNIYGHISIGTRFKCSDDEKAKFSKILFYVINNNLEFKDEIQKVKFIESILDNGSWK